MRRLLLVLATFSFTASGRSAEPAGAAPLPGTAPLLLEGDIASHLVAGVDRFLLGEIGLSVERRLRHWKRDFASWKGYESSIEPNRGHLARILVVEIPSVLSDLCEPASGPPRRCSPQVPPQAVTTRLASPAACPHTSRHAWTTRSLLGIMTASSSRL